MTPDDMINATRTWLERAVIGLNLCPFAKSPFANGAIRYVVSDATTIETLQQQLAAELEFLNGQAPGPIETTLLIHPHVLTDFYEYNDFLDIADATLTALELDGVIQIASFHPQYQFGGTAPDDITNFTNRSPYPMLHLLLESSVEAALAAYPDAEKIIDRNLETMQRLGLKGWHDLDVGPAKEPS